MLSYLYSTRLTSKLTNQCFSHIHYYLYIQKVSTINKYGLKNPI